MASKIKIPSPPSGVTVLEYNPRTWGTKLRHYFGPNHRIIVLPASQPGTGRIQVIEDMESGGTRTLSGNDEDGGDLAKFAQVIMSSLYSSFPKRDEVKAVVRGIFDGRLRPRRRDLLQTFVSQMISEGLAEELNIPNLSVSMENMTETGKTSLPVIEPPSEQTNVHDVVRAAANRAMSNAPSANGPVQSSAVGNTLIRKTKTGVEYNLRVFGHLGWAPAKAGVVSSELQRSMLIFSTTLPDVFGELDASVIAAAARCILQTDEDEFRVRQAEQRERDAQICRDTITMIVEQQGKDLTKIPLPG